MRRLNGEALTGLVLILPVFADLGDHAAELVPDDGRMLRHVIGNALVLRALHSSLVGAHADRVGNDLDLNIVRTYRRQVDLFQTQIHFAMDSYSFRLHVRFLPF